ncbi:hypothetical protein JOL62DRAFT_385333 [Phyllosticta paracitricarpa]|uniref:Secreted protein n=1 Tax=Phyllosticta paracitricarpa TaxID=2016321 RepID=A0ABR1NH61_9PEZI
MIAPCIPTLLLMLWLRVPRPVQQQQQQQQSQPACQPTLWTNTSPSIAAAAIQDVSLHVVAIIGLEGVGGSIAIRPSGAPEIARTPFCLVPQPYLLCPLFCLPCSALVFRPAAVLQRRLIENVRHGHRCRFASCLAAQSSAAELPGCVAVGWLQAARDLSSHELASLRLRHGSIELLAVLSCSECEARFFFGSASTPITLLRVRRDACLLQHVSIGVVECARHVTLAALENRQQDVCRLLAARTRLDGQASTLRW